MGRIPAKRMGPVAYYLYRALEMVSPGSGQVQVERGSHVASNGVR